MQDTERRREETAFASATRETIATVRAQRAALLAEPTAVAMLEAMPGAALVLNLRRQIVSVNRLLSEELGLVDADSVLGMRLGEAAGCVHSDERAAGCGTSGACSQCGAVNAMLDCITTRRRVTRECRLATGRRAAGGALDFRLHASYLPVGELGFIVIGLEDIGDEKRRQVLERMIFQDVMGAARDVRDLAAELVRTRSVPGGGETVGRTLGNLSVRLVEQIEAQRMLRAAEQGDLPVEPRETEMTELLHQVVERLRGEQVSEGRTLRLESVRRCRVETDPVLLARALASLVRNALEATPVGGTVDITCEYDHEIATIAVHNSGVIPDNVQLQIFQRSFSTRNGEGRGIGTYATRLIVERYLGGKVAFMSEARVGTLFLAMLPRRLECRVNA